MQRWCQSWEWCRKDNKMLFIASAKVIFIFLVWIIETHDSWAAQMSWPRRDHFLNFPLINIWDPKKPVLWKLYSPPNGILPSRGNDPRFPMTNKKLNMKCLSCLGLIFFIQLWITEFSYVSLWQQSFIHKKWRRSTAPVCLSVCLSRLSRWSGASSTAFTLGCTSPAPSSRCSWRSTASPYTCGWCWNWRALSAPPSTTSTNSSTSWPTSRSASARSSTSPGTSSTTTPGWTTAGASCSPSWWWTSWSWFISTDCCAPTSASQGKARRSRMGRTAAGSSWATDRGRLRGLLYIFTQVGNWPVFVGQDLSCLSCRPANKCRWWRFKLEKMKSNMAMLTWIHS